MEAEFEFDWNSKQGLVLGNPRWPDPIKKQVSECEFPLDNGIVWVASSGTQGATKFFGLDRPALIISAESVNQHLGCNKSDLWLNPLPLFHVGGLCVSVRSFVGDYKHINVWTPKWDARKYVEQLSHYKASLTSLVPTQVYDLVTFNLQAPTSLRAAVVGGGAMSDALYWKARKLGWPLLPSYGLTECCSQVATATLESLRSKTLPELDILSHVELRIGERSNIEIKSSSLFSMTSLISKNGLEVEPRTGDWYSTNDLGELNHHHLKFLGRSDDLVKINGELVSLQQAGCQLENVLVSEGLVGAACLAALPNERSEHFIVLVLETRYIEHREKILEAYSRRVSPLERPGRLYVVDEIPKTSLGKIKRQELSEWLQGYPVS